MKENFKWFWSAVIAILLIAFVSYFSYVLYTYAPVAGGIILVILCTILTGLVKEKIFKKT